MSELTKNERKIARSILSQSIEKEFEAALRNSESLMSKWKCGDESSRVIFHEMRNYLNDFMKHLQYRYDALRNADYPLILAGILKDGYITSEDLKEFSEEARQMIERYNGLF